MTDPILDPAGMLESQRIVVVVGTGGVGKTTVAAAAALEAARRGRRVLALTIDPARRLCGALGLDFDLGNEEREASRNAATDLRSEALELPPERQKEFGIRQGSLHVVMLDMKRTFDGLVHRFAENEEVEARIRENPIYQHVSDALAGSSEYAAMEKVFELSESGEYDLIVVDTPPSQHALDFLDAPRRLLEFLDSRLVQLLFHPAMAAGRFGFRLFHRTGQKILRGLERVSGVGFLEDISEFLLAFEEMSDGFRQRAGEVRKLLLGPTSSFLLVAGPSPLAARQALEFLARIGDTGAPMAGICVNRVRVWPDENFPSHHFLDETVTPAQLEPLARALERVQRETASSFDAMSAARTAVDVAKGYASLVKLDDQSATLLREHAAENGHFFRQIPELPRDVHDLRGLSRIAEKLFDADPTPSGMPGRAA
jgi:anion-transporting  ArsA/GET3 family ATPase